MPRPSVFALHRCLSLLVCAAALTGSLARGADPSRVLPTGEKPKDVRLQGQRTLNDKEHPWTPPNSKAAWESEADKIRRQLLVSCGLWPMPERPPVQPVIHGLVDRGDYTVERVFFESRPGLFVTGSLFRPKKIDGKAPGVLCPHGHWLNGRFYDAGDKAALEQLGSGAETYLSGARSPLQARMIQLARMGCVVFFYDMLGTADQGPLAHSGEFADVKAELWLQNRLGLQTWNSIRALDFLCGLPDVDTSRIGVTGASGGGTQTFMLCALDERPTVAFPAVMVSTAMQGGCQCENASYLRLGINNVAIAALTAPRPMALSGADDWTIDIETKGLPELKAIYALYSRAGDVAAKCYPQFGHNYNEVSREMMYAWFAEHLNLADVAPREQVDFWPLSKEELTVFTADHPRPEAALTAEKLRELMTKEAKEEFSKLQPKTTADAAKYREVVGGAAAVMLGDGVPGASDLKSTTISESTADNVLTIKGLVTVAGKAIPILAVAPTNGFTGEAVLWFDGRGKSHLYDAQGKLVPPVQDLLKSGYSVVSADVFQTGEFLGENEAATFAVNDQFPGYTYCYNAPLLTERVRDVLAAIGAAKLHPRVVKVHLVGTGDAGLWVLLARAVAGNAVAGKTVVDLQGFQFADVSAIDDPRLLPGALKYGDVAGLAGLIAPGALDVSGIAADWNVGDGLPHGAWRLSKDALKPADVPARLKAKP